MTLLAAALYDPAVAVSKAVGTSPSSLCALTAFDTTNLRLTFTAPASGNVLVVMRCVMTGNTTESQILLGVLESSTVVGRMTPAQNIGGTAVSTTHVTLETQFEVTGLSGSHTWDAAYAVQAAVANEIISYGGPNDTTANNAYGGFRFAIYAI